MIGEGRDPVVELAAEGADFVGVFGHRFLAPTVGGGFEEGDEGGRRGEQNAAGKGAVHETGIGGERGGEKMVAGQKKHDELRGGLELLPVVLGAEGVDVAPDLLGMFGEAGGAGGFVGGIHGGAVGFERGLGVDDDALAAGEADDEIGSKSAGGGGLLFGEVAIGQHVGHLDDPAKLEFAPTAGEGRGAEGGGKLAGFRLELELGGAEGLELLAEGTVSGGAGFFDFRDLAVNFLQRLAERLHEGVDRELAFFEIAGGLGLELGERLAGLLEEIGAVGAEGVGGKGLELGDEALVGRTLGGEFGGALGVEGGELLQLGTEGGDFGREAEVVLVEGAGALDQSRGAAVPEYPRNDSGEQSGEKGGDDERHVKIRLKW